MTATEDREYYEISAVSRFTGLSTHVLRVWEKRYDVVEPERTDSGRRRYSRTDVTKLTLLKALVDSGHTISSIADLDISALEHRLSEVQETPHEMFESSGVSPKSNVGFVGIQSSVAVHDASESGGFSIVSESGDIETMVKNTKPRVIDILIVEVNSFFPEDLKIIHKALTDLSAGRAIVIYQFASSKVFETVDARKISLLRGPVNAAEVQLACGRGGRIEKQGKTNKTVNLEVDEHSIPARLFTPEQLRAISKRASVVKCECPQHLTNLLSGLVAFEEYSGRCEVLNEEDAKLHGYLQQETANCRLRLERALQAVLDSEGIQI
jgi:DNA-binding transcriptional MerR regulator